MLQNLIRSGKIFEPSLEFREAALEVFRYQYTYNALYKNYVNALGVRISGIDTIEAIPFLPIRFFKSHKITTKAFEAAAIFESSGTTATLNSRHYVKDLHLYELSFIHAFQKFYGNISDWCIIGLLPSYLERKHSSLVYMTQKLIGLSGHSESGFYLHEFEKLAATLKELELKKQQTLLIGVTFALLDFASEYPMPLRYTTIMETGGMKGRRKELVRQEVHDLLKTAFNVNAIHSEYGMTELLSQAYSKGEGRFQTPPWMRVLLRDEEDPLTIKQVNPGEAVRGIINIIDLANIHSCSFITTDDLGVMHPDGSFEVTGRMDHSDLRGCSLMAASPPSSLSGREGE